jgi:hypothetical protein
MAVPDTDGYADLFAGLENAQADLVTSPDVADMRAIVERVHGSALDRFDALVQEFAQTSGDESAYLEDLRAVLTAIPYGDVFTRPYPGSDEWVWAANRGTPAADWQSMETLTGETAGAVDSTAEISVLDESNAIYVRALTDVAEPSQEEAAQVWEAIWAKVTERAATWTESSADEVLREVLDTFYAGLTTGEETIDDIIAEVQEFRSAVAAASAAS